MGRRRKLVFYDWEKMGMESEYVEIIRIEYFRSSWISKKKVSIELEVGFGLRKGYFFRIEEIWVCLLVRGRKLENLRGLEKNYGINEVKRKIMWR